MRIEPGDLDDPRVVAMIVTHTSRARAKTAHGSAHSLDPADLKRPGIHFFAAREGDELVGMGALRCIDADNGELKSMFVADGARGRGVGGAIVTRLIAAAREQGLARVSLETGSWDYFIPARAMYRRHGFVDCPPFGDYLEDGNSRFMTLEL